MAEQALPRSLPSSSFTGIILVPERVYGCLLWAPAPETRVSTSLFNFKVVATQARVLLKNAVSVVTVRVSSELSNTFHTFVMPPKPAPKAGRPWRPPATVAAPKPRGLRPAPAPKKPLPFSRPPVAAAAAAAATAAPPSAVSAGRRPPATVGRSAAVSAGTSAPTPAPPPVPPLPLRAGAGGAAASAAGSRGGPSALARAGGAVVGAKPLSSSGVCVSGRAWACVGATVKDSVRVGLLVLVCMGGHGWVWVSALCCAFVVASFL